MDGHSDVLRRRPVERHFWIAGAASKVAVLVVPPRCLDLQLPEEGEVEGVAKNGNVQLRKASPNLAPLGIGQDGYEQSGRAGAVKTDETDARTCEGTADSRFYRPRRHIEQGTIEF